MFYSVDLMMYAVVVIMGVWYGVKKIYALIIRWVDKTYEKEMKEHKEWLKSERRISTLN